MKKENEKVKKEKKKLLGRPVIILVLSLVLVAGVLGTVFQYSTAKTLELAEALQFRRMLVAQQGNQRICRFFYVTNRRTNQTEVDLQERFGNERVAGLQFGIFDTEIELSLGIGMLVNPSDWFQNEEIQLREVTALKRDEFIEQVQQQVDASPDRSLLININGFRERFPSALRKTAFLAHVLDMNTPILVFDWPGDQGSTIRG